MQEINRAMADHLDASEMLKRITEPLEQHPPQVATQYQGNRAERRAAERAHRRQAKKIAAK